MIEALKSAGWEFACNGYDGTNYGSDEEAVSADLTKWNESVGTLVGNTTILLFPSGTDSRGWKAYDESDPVYQILKKQGFLYYGSMDISGTKTQLTEQYLRCSYMNVDGYRMYQDLYKDAGRLRGFWIFRKSMTANDRWQRMKQIHRLQAEKMKKSEKNVKSGRYTFHLKKNMI